MKAISRRKFLGGAAGLAAFPLVLPGCARGGSAAVAPNSRINIGLVGIGAQGRGHLGAALGNPDLQVVAVCDVHGGRAEHYKEVADKKYGGKDGYKGCKSFIDFREMLALPGLDAVLIAVPDHWHALIAVAACRAGKDVYLEKPLALTNHESRAIADAAREYGVVFQTGSQQRSDATFRFACELARNGAIGKVKEVYTNIGGPPKPFCDLPADPLPPTLNWDMWIGPSQWRPYTKAMCPDGWEFGFPAWRSYGEFGGGGQADFGAHHYDIAQWGLGTDHTGPVEAIGPNGKDIKRLTYRYADGTMMYVGSRINGDNTTWVGEKGLVSVARGSFLYTEPAELADLRFGPNDVRLYNSRNQFQNWVDCIRTRRDPICPAETGHRTATICQIGNIAYRMGGVSLRWDPVAERFTNSEEANRLLRREMRGPWSL